METQEALLLIGYLVIAFILCIRWMNKYLWPRIGQQPPNINPMEPIITHRKRHIELHKSLDELFADYISHHPNQTQFTQMPIIDLIKWSKEQTENPVNHE